MEHSLFCQNPVAELASDTVHVREYGLDSPVFNLLDVSLAGINYPKYCLHFLLRIKKKKKVFSPFENKSMHSVGIKPTWELCLPCWLCCGVAAQFSGWSTTRLLQNQILNCLHYFLSEIEFFKVLFKEMCCFSYLS